MDIKTALENIKAIKEIADSMQNIELQSHIVDLKEQILELRDENFDLKEQLRQRTEHNMIFENHVYWDLKEDGTKDGPFCPVCWDKEHLQIRIGDEYNAYPSGVYRHCYNCKNNIRIR